jgi:hypothetical protein
MAPFATPAFLALATATGILRVAGSVPALLRVRTSRALGANTFSTIQVLVAKMRKWEKSTIIIYHGKWVITVSWVIMGKCEGNLGNMGK